MDRKIQNNENYYTVASKLNCQCNINNNSNKNNETWQNNSKIYTGEMGIKHRKVSILKMRT